MTQLREVFVWRNYGDKLLDRMSGTVARAASLHLRIIMLRVRADDRRGNLALVVRLRLSRSNPAGPR